MTKVVAFNGSPHQNGNTYNSLKLVCDALEKQGIHTEIVQVGGKLFQGCIDCGHCKNVKDQKCALDKDEMNDYIAKAIAADGILIGSPVYFGNMTPETKALIDRVGRVTRSNGFLLKNKVGAAVVAARRAGSNFTFAGINLLFTISQMVVASSSYWNFTMAAAQGDWEQDTEAQATMQTLGDNMSFLLKKLEA
ncbi:MAG: flavodoxin family protein [Christensenellaceae bacterium]